MSTRMRTNPRARWRAERRWSTYKYVHCGLHGAASSPRPMSTQTLGAMNPYGGEGPTISPIDDPDGDYDFDSNEHTGYDAYGYKHADSDVEETASTHVPSSDE